MIFEKLENFKVDIDKLRTHLLSEVVAYGPPSMQSSHFGGWSVLSAQGTCEDGWQQGHTCYREVDGKTVFDVERAKAIGLKGCHEHVRETPICSGYLKEIIDQIRALNLEPRRARISLLRSQGASAWHRDARPENYAVRLHIPIITSPECLFIAEEGSAHLPADGSAYLLKVNRMHKVINPSNRDRFHLIMQVWDQDHISQEHRFYKNQELGHAVGP